MFEMQATFWTRNGQLRMVLARQKEPRSVVTEEQELPAFDFFYVKGK